MLKQTKNYQVAVIGGGLAGFCAAVAAARQGMKTCLVHNRPVLGGNSSSEIRVTPHGAAAFHAYARETGIISELLIQERAVNHEEIFENGWTNSIWDITQYDLAKSTDNLTLLLNTDFIDVEMSDKRNIKSIKVVTQNAEVETTIESQLFIDCSGDGLVADKAGCEWRMGSEGKAEFNEPHAPEEASNDVMGNSIHFKTKKMDFEVPFTAPDWAMKYDDASFFYEDGRPPKEERGGYWWLEIGVPYNTIHDNEEIRHELTRHALGVWDWMKNKDPKMKEVVKNYALDWMGQVPGKRESRRIMGQYLMTEHDPQNRTVFKDEIAFGGWFIDLHTPGGLLAKHSEPASGEDYNTFSEYAVKSYAGPYGIPLRCLIAKDVDNLMMAGRNVSVTHAALGTVRVMSTTALLGQAAGTAAAIAIQNQIAIADVPEKYSVAVQQQLLKDGCFLPNYKNEDPADLALNAVVTASSEALEYGAGPETKGFHHGLKIWKDQPQYLETALKNRRGQLIAIGSNELHSLSICVNNLSNEIQKLNVSLLAVDHIWDYRIQDRPVLASGEILVPMGQKIWVEWNIELKNLKVGQFLRLDVMANDKVEWLCAEKIVSGHLGTYQIGQDKMRRFGNGHTLSFKVEPPQACYGAQNVTSGVTRPYQFTNLWKSDPALPLPQWLGLKWNNTQIVKEISVTFPGHLLREYHAYSPMYRDAQCPRDYSVSAWVNGGWKTILEIKNNFQRYRKHALNEAVETNSIRLTVHATNGDPSAQVYEIRCY